MERDFGMGLRRKRTGRVAREMAMVAVRVASEHGYLRTTVFPFDFDSANRAAFRRVGQAGNKCSSRGTVVFGGA